MRSRPKQPTLKQTLPVRAIAILIAALTHVCLNSSPVCAQAGLRESLERLDRNKDGKIEPSEITPLSRPFFERLSRAENSQARVVLSKTYSIGQLQEIIRRYHAMRNGESGRKDIPPSPDMPLQSFVPKNDETLVPQFGLGKMRFRYTQDDLDFVDRTMKSHDENKDGYIDRHEASRHKWTHRNPFDDDLDKDDRLSRMEMAQRYARRRLLESSADELRKNAMRTRGPTEKNQPNKRSEGSLWWRKGGSDYWLTASLMSRFDWNKDGQLDGDELKEIGFPIGAIDVNRDQAIDRDEMFAYLRAVQNDKGGSAESPPEWFYESDGNDDDQVSLFEYAPEFTNEKLAQFSKLDINGDGLITIAEAIRAKDAYANSYNNDEGELLPPRKTFVSTIDVADDFVIADLNVQLSISHTYVSYMDVYLVSPDGQRIELFTAIGGSDDHFDDTILDDQAEESIARGKAPYKGSFQPEGLARSEPSLAAFNGKSIRGKWQLIVRHSRSDRFGMVNGWKLIATPE